MHAAVVPKAHVVVKAFSVEPFEHIIDGLVRISCEQYALTLLAEPFHNLGNDACLSRARGTLYQQVILHLQGSLVRKDLFGVEIIAWWNADEVKSRPCFSGYKLVHVRISLLPEQ